MRHKNLIARPYALQEHLVTGVAQCYVNGAWCEVAVHETVSAVSHTETAARRVDAGAVVRWHTLEQVRVR